MAYRVIADEVVSIYGIMTATEQSTKNPGAAFTMAPMLSPRAASTVIAMVMWPLALMTFVHKVFLVPQNHHVTDDFTTVITALQRFRAGVAVYSENYATVDPHYLYSPGGTLLLSPLAWLPDADVSRAVYIFANGVATVIAVAIVTRFFGFRLLGGVFPAAMFFLFSTEAVENNLLFSNINGILLLAEVVFLWALLCRRDLVAGIVLGLAITIKPQFAPLLLLPLMRRQWLTMASSVAVPIVFNVLGWLLMVRPGDYFDKLVPYLGQVRDYANSSIAGVGVHFGFPDWSIALWRAVAATCVIIAVAGLARFRDRDELMWATTTSGILLTGVFLISSLGQMYYSMLLLPMLFTVTRARSIMHNPVAWLGVYLCLSLDVWFSDRWVGYGRIMEYARGTAGWFLIILAAATTVVVWMVNEHRAGRPILGDLRTNGILGGRKH